MRSIREINDVFESIANRHAELNGFFTNSAEETAIDQYDVTKFPYLYAQCTNLSIAEGVTKFTYVVQVVEREQKDLTDVYSAMHLIWQDVIAVLHNTLFSNKTFGNMGSLTMEMPVRLDAFTSQNNDLVTGFEAQLVISTPNELDLCNSLGNGGPLA